MKSESLSVAKEAEPGSKILPLETHFFFVLEHFKISQIEKML